MSDRGVFKMPPSKVNEIMEDQAQRIKRQKEKIIATADTLRSIARQLTQFSTSLKQEQAGELQLLAAEISASANELSNGELVPVNYHIRDGK